MRKCKVCGRKRKRLQKPGRMIPFRSYTACCGQLLRKKKSDRLKWELFEIELEKIRLRDGTNNIIELMKKLSEAR